MTHDRVSEWTASSPEWPLDVLKQPIAVNTEMTHL